VSLRYPSDLTTSFGMGQFLEKLFADGGYHGQVSRKAAAKVLPHLKIEIVKRSHQPAKLQASIDLRPRRTSLLALLANCGRRPNKIK
jgi:hypothetical protein